MAFQTRVLRDGEWVTETVNLQAALKASAAPQLASEPLPDPPVCGILSQTIVESPVVRWVLPARLRSSTHNDIAFVGDHFVQISELGRDGQVHDVIRKTDFGHRIRNAVVLGGSLEHGLDDDPIGTAVKQEPSPSPSPPGEDGVADDPQLPKLPPQMLVLVLESCQMVFIFVTETPGGVIEFVANTYENPKLLPYVGYHLAVDPSSRYMAAATPEGIFIVYELEALPVLNRQFANREFVHPIKSFRIRAVSGVVQKMEFLFPRPEDRHHIILILIIVRRERLNQPPISRMATYEWELGDNLQHILSEERIGDRLPKEYKMPLLLIPLRFKTAFFAVSEFYIGIVKYALSGAPEFEMLPAEPPATTPLYHGHGDPLWVAWARPFRRKKYLEKTDIIYLAREDGAIIHIEIDAAELLPSVTNVGCLEANIDTAFTSAYDIFADVLMIGGDSGPGGIWKLAPREDIQQVSILSNWSPVIDITSTNELPTWSANGTDLQSGQHQQPTTVQKNRVRQQDSIFSASCRGLKGSVVQWRLGLQARIGLDIETGEPIRQAWTFTTHRGIEPVLYGLLALPHSSTVLRFSESLDQVDMVPAEDTPFDLTSRTLHAVQVSDIIVQVSETSINVTTPRGSSRCSIAEVLGIADVTAESAFCIGHVVVFSTHTDQVSRLHVMQAQEIEFSLVKSWDAQGEVTCVSIFTVSSGTFVVATSMCDGVPWLSIYSTTGEPIVAKAITANPLDHGAASTELEALTSISVADQGTGEVHLVLGTRCGSLITARVSDQSPDDISWNSEAIGVARVDVFPSSIPFEEKSPTFACCDNGLLLLSGFSPRSCKFTKKDFIWLTDSNEPSMPSPPIHSIHKISQSLSGQKGHTSLLVLAGSRLLLADFSPHVGNVPRSIPVQGTPTKIIFSQMLNCLIVAMITDDKPTLVFIDPDTGAIISVPTDKDKNRAEYISGLGHSDDKIHGLHEWLYKKDGRVFPFIIVTTHRGRLIIVSTEKLGARSREGENRQLRYWTRYKKQLSGPIFSIVGNEEGLLYCVGQTLHWETLDLAEKRLKPIKQFQLDSSATQLRIFKGKLFALTSEHSLEVIDYQSDEGTMELIHCDRVSRKTIHMIDVGNPADGHGQWPLTLVSDQVGSIAGLWVPLGQRDREFEVVFEGVLGSSVRRFLRARVRPLWLADNTHRRYGTLPITHDDSDIIGVSLDGSVKQFSLLSLELWRFLIMVQTLAHVKNKMALFDKSAINEKVDIMSLDLQPSPRIMHIDGDLLKRCVKKHNLEASITSEDAFDLFCSRLDAIEGGNLTAEFKDTGKPDRREKYMELAYEILEFLSASAL